MKRILLLILLLGPFVALIAQDDYQWAPPLLEYQTIFFKKETSVSMKFAQPGTSIHYTLQDRKPTASDPTYLKPVSIKNRFTKISAAVFGKPFRSSDAVRVEFIKDGLPFKTTLLTATNPKYPGTGPNTLSDNMGGITGISNPGWMGFDGDTVRLEISFEKATAVNEVLLHLLQAEGSWVFLPKKTNVYYRDPKTNSRSLLGTTAYPADKETVGAACVSQILKAKTTIYTDRLFIEMVVVNQIPDWHPGKGLHGWLFIDEIKVY